MCIYPMGKPTNPWLSAHMGFVTICSLPSSRVLVAKAILGPPLTLSIILQQTSCPCMYNWESHPNPVTIRGKGNQFLLPNISWQQPEWGCFDQHHQQRGGSSISAGCWHQTPPWASLPKGPSSPASPIPFCLPSTLSVPNPAPHTSFPRPTLPGIHQVGKWHREAKASPLTGLPSSWVTGKVFYGIGEK